MPPCIECTQLWDVYINLSLTYRIALGAAKRRSDVADANLSKMRYASELARQTLQEHELTHSPKPPETTATVERRNSKGAVILLPPVSREGFTALKR